MSTINLPKEIMYDLEGYRGFHKIPFALKIEYVDALNKWRAHYSRSDAEYALAVVWGKSREEVIQKMKQELINYNLL